MLPSGQLPDLFIWFTTLSLLWDFVFVPTHSHSFHTVFIMCDFEIAAVIGFEPLKQAWHIRPPVHHHAAHSSKPPARPPASRTPPQADPHTQTTQQWLLSGRLIKAIVVMYVALSQGYCVPMDNVLPSSIPIVPFETELGKYPIYRPSNNGLMFPYKC